MELRIHMLKDILRILRNIRAVFQTSTCRHDMVGRNLVADLNHCDALQGFCHRLSSRHLADVRTTHNLCPWHTLAGCIAEEEHAVVNRKTRRFNNVTCERHRASIGETSGQCSSSCCLRAHEKNLRRLRARASFKITIARTKTDRIRARRHVVSNAKSTGVFQYAHTGADKIT